MTPVFLFDYTSWGDWRVWLDDHAASIVTIVVLLAIVNIVFRRVVSRIFHSAIARAAKGRGGGDDPVGIRRRADTLTATLNWAFGLILAFVGATLVLEQVGVSVTALIAGVGVVGIAIGLGAQALVRDVINGIFILIEDQYRVGDVVQVANVSGTVVEINPRRTVIRDADGNVHSIPNGSITVATNMTQGFSSINLDVSVTYDTDLERAKEVITEECEVLARERPRDFINVPRVQRVQAMLENYLVLRISGDVRPGLQWDLTGELRLRIKQAFDREGITMTPAGRWRPEPEPETAPPPPAAE